MADDIDDLLNDVEKKYFKSNQTHNCASSGKDLSSQISGQR